MPRVTYGPGLTVVQIIFASIFQRIIFKVVPSYLSMLGTVIIMGSAVYVAVCRLLIEPNTDRLH
jgi:hypothetical protein